MPGRPMTEEQKRKKRRRERELKFFSWTLKRLLFLRMSYFKRMHISKKWFSRFFLCSGMTLEFLLLTGIK